LVHLVIVMSVSSINREQLCLSLTNSKRVVL